MRSVEDETDAAAAAALEQENAAELAEFTMEPAARVSLHADQDGAGERQRGGGLPDTMSLLAVSSFAFCTHPSFLVFLLITSMHLLGWTAVVQALIAC